VFFDDFDGGELAAHWQVSGADPESFIVEEGVLLSMNNQLGGLSGENAKNVFSLSEALPAGDFDAIARFSGEFATGRDRAEFGLWADSENFLVARLVGEANGSGCSNISLDFLKHVRGEETIFRIPLRGKIGCGGPSAEDFSAVLSMIESSGATMVISKRGRQYSASLQFGGEVDGAGNPVTYTTPTLSSLRVPGPLSFASGKSQANRPGEILVLWDSIEVISIPSD
jgi:hypothetical protein